MKLIIHEQYELDVIPCDCCAYTQFIHLDAYHTDTWLECPKCGRRTWNTGGYHYASEIPLKDAKEAAIKAWNNKEYRPWN